MSSFPTTSLCLLACGQVFCDTCSIYRTIVPWIDSDKPVRVCKQCHDTPKSRPPPSISTPSSSATQSDRNKPNGSKNRQNGYENGSSGDSTSTVSSGEHLSDLCLTPNDIFDIDQPRAGMRREDFVLCLLVSTIEFHLILDVNAPFVHAG